MRTIRSSARRYKAFLGIRVTYLYSSETLCSSNSPYPVPMESQITLTDSVSDVPRQFPYDAKVPGPMDSQFTLTNVSAQGVLHTALSFDRDDMKNTKIYSADGKTLYTVETLGVSDSHTVIYRADTREKVASVNKRDIIPDVISFGDQPSMRLSKWLHGKKGDWSDLLGGPLLSPSAG